MMRASTAIAAALCALCLPAWTSWAGPDRYEPDNRRASARKLPRGVVQNRSIDKAGDTDWAKFTLGGLGARNFNLNTIGNSPSDTFVGLYNYTGTLIASDDDSGPGKYSSIRIALLPRGTYYARIREYGNDGVIPSYRLGAVWTPIAIPPDAYEPDNFSSGAKLIANGQKQSRTIHVAGNVDWAKFTLDQAGARNIRLETGGTSGDTQMWLYRQNRAGTGAGTAIAHNNDGGAGNFAEINVASLPPGTYYIKIQENGNNLDLPAYSLQAAWTPIPIPADAFESDNVSGRAKVITNGEKQQRTIHAAGNVDWAKFTIGAAGSHTVRIETAGKRGDTQLWLYKQSSTGTSAGKRIGYNNNGGGGYFDRIQLSSLAAGTYYIKVQEYGNDGTIAAYALHVSWTAAPYDRRFPAEIDGPITWLHTDVSDWPATSKMTARIEDNKIHFPHTKADVWPPENTHDLALYGNPWVIVKWRDGKWYAATFEWLRPGQTSKPVGVLDGSKGDHIKRSPLSNWRPRKGERFGIMVSGLARGGARNVSERTNVQMVTWPY